MAKIRFLEPASHGGARLPAAPVRVLGIDLGTTNSTVAEGVWDPNGEAAPRARCLAIDQETLEKTVRDSLVPSVVAVVAGRTIVGLGASRLRREPADVGGYVLRLLHRGATATGPADRVVVTVPTSFQSNQRAETVRATDSSSRSPGATRTRRPKR